MNYIEISLELGVNPLTVYAISVIDSIDDQLERCDLSLTERKNLLKRKKILNALRNKLQ
jgi:hypothetical protein